MDIIIKCCKQLKCYFTLNNNKLLVLQVLLLIIMTYCQNEYTDINDIS